MALVKSAHSERHYCFRKN